MNWSLIDDKILSGDVDGLQMSVITNAGRYRSS
jgi:hypothetical protein